MKHKKETNPNVRKAYRTLYGELFTFTLFNAGLLFIAWYFIPWILLSIFFNLIIIWIYSTLSIAIIDDNLIYIASARCDKAE